MVNETTFTVTGGSGHAVRGDLRWRQGSVGAPALIICHGFTAHKDWGLFPHAGRRFAELGFASIVFNFSHNGIGENFRRFTELEKFSRNTIRKELEDVQALLNAITAGSIGAGVIDAGRLGIIGHSRGGGIAILSAAKDQRLRGVGAWSSVSTFHRYTTHQRQLWEHQGYLPVRLKGGTTKLRLGIDLLHDLEAHREEYDLRRAVATLQVPLLLVHGSADVAVKLQEAEELFDVADHSRTELTVLPGVGHLYGATHPYRTQNPTVEHVLELTARWFHLIP